MCGGIRKTRFAGSWYSDDEAILRANIAAWTTAPNEAQEPPPIALIGPHAGLRFSGAVSGRGYGILNPDSYARIFLLGPSHYQYFEGIALPSPNLTGYHTPLGSISLDMDALSELRDLPGFDGPPDAHDREHSLELHTPFISHLFGHKPMVPLVVGRLGSDPAVRGLAGQLRNTLKDGDLLIISSDFTHYGASFGYEPFSDEIPQNLESLAQKAIAPILAGELEGFTTHIRETGDTICGREPIRLLLATVPEGSQGQLIQFDTSGNMTGDYAHTVSYASIVLSHPNPWHDRQGRHL